MSDNNLESFEVPTQFTDQLIAYLQRRPYVEVKNFIEGLQHHYKLAEFAAEQKKETANSKDKPKGKPNDKPAKAV